MIFKDGQQSFLTMLPLVRLRATSLYIQLGNGKLLYLPLSWALYHIPSLQSIGFIWYTYTTVTKHWLVGSRHICM